MKTEALCGFGPHLNERVIKRLEELNASLLCINLSHMASSDAAERYTNEWGNDKVITDCN